MKTILNEDQFLIHKDALNIFKGNILRVYICIYYPFTSLSKDIYFKNAKHKPPKCSTVGEQLNNYAIQIHQNYAFQGDKDQAINNQ